MNATEIVLPGTVEPEDLQVSTRELPEPGPGQAVVRVEATGVSFAEQQMRRGKYYDQPPFPFVPGYDLVGEIERLGDGDGAEIVVGQRVAALTKTGGWADRVVLDAADLVPVPVGVERRRRGDRRRQRHHRPADAQPQRPGAARADDRRPRRGRRRRLDPGAARPPRGRPRDRHRGARRSRNGSASSARSRSTTATSDVPARVRELAPDGVAAVFDHVGGAGIVDSWQMLARGGTLVSYGTASTRTSPAIHGCRS